ncbi:hypothetical protein BU17DRAFT_47785, partial [Hysterangium stoloniferum]
PTSSIVAIHGLDGHREASFTAPNGVLWLRDLLPEALPTARILTYGYDARTHSENRSSQTLYDLSTDFVGKLSNFRIHTKSDRPLIFIAHSFGGIMLKNALIHAHTTHNKHLPSHKAVEVSSYGIIYLGTPHQGVDLTSWTKSLFRSLSTTIQTGDLITKHLGLHSETLQQQIAQYNAISGRYHTVFCYATYGTASDGSSMDVSSFFHVPAFSAVVQGAINTQALAIHKTHMGLAQFTSRDDNEYDVLMQCLLQMVEKASFAILTNWEKHCVSLGRQNQFFKNPGIVFNIREGLLK